MLGVSIAALLAGVSGAATAVAPKNTGEPAISGTPRVGEVLRTTRGTWTGTKPITFAYRWYRCEGRGKPDASDCARVSNAIGSTYTLRAADAGFQVRSQVKATNADGSAVATSNPTTVVTSAAPVNTTPPSISGSAIVNQLLSADAGVWTGVQPITYAFRWLRCNAQGDNCAQIAGATDNKHKVVAGDVGRTLRVNVTAENAKGRMSERSAQTAIVTSGTTPPPPGGSIPVDDLKAGGDQLVIAQVQFNPNPVRSRTAPIVVRVRITARQGRPVHGALVFMRATPRVVDGQTLSTQADGWVTLTLRPNAQFPVPRSGFNVQFFIRAYRAGDSTGSIDGSRLVQVPLAG
jgi:hypothetical protein